MCHNGVALVQSNCSVRKRVVQMSHKWRHWDTTLRQTTLRQTTLRQTTLSKEAISPKAQRWWPLHEDLLSLLPTLTNQGPSTEVSHLLGDNDHFTGLFSSDSTIVASENERFSTIRLEGPRICSMSWKITWSTWCNLTLLCLQKRKKLISIKSCFCWHLILNVTIETSSGGWTTLSCGNVILDRHYLLNYAAIYEIMTSYKPALLRGLSVYFTSMDMFTFTFAFQVRAHMVC